MSKKQATKRSSSPSEGLSQAQLAERVGCAQSTVSRAVARGDLRPLGDGRFPAAAVDVLWKSLQYERRHHPRKVGGAATDAPADEKFDLTAAELEELVAAVPASASAAAQVEDDEEQDGPPYRRGPELEACHEVENYVRELLGSFTFGDSSGPTPLDVLRALAVAFAARASMCGRAHRELARALWRAVAALASASSTTSGARRHTKEI